MEVINGLDDNLEFTRGPRVKVMQIHDGQPVAIFIPARIEDGETTIDAAEAFNAYQMIAQLIEIGPWVR